ncbi:MAG: phage minor tail protein G [Leclercia sp.]
MSKYLKSGLFEYGAESMTLYELSALQRIEHLQFITHTEKQLPVDADEKTLYPLLVEQNIRLGARIVAMSLWQADPATSNVDQLHQDVLSGWPIDMIGAADRFVKTLSDMMPAKPEHIENGENDAEEEALSPEKSSPVS